jgi:hypothetical protein
MFFAGPYRQRYANLRPAAGNQRLKALGVAHSVASPPKATYKTA